MVEKLKLLICLPVWLLDNFIRENSDLIAYI